MSFEDLQQQWGSQFAGSPRDENSPTEIELLDRIRRSERNFRWIVFLLVLRDAVVLALLVRMLESLLGHGGHLTAKMIRHQRTIGLIEAGVALALSIAVVRFRPKWTHLTPSVAEGRAALGGRIRRDERRFNAMILWRDLREIAVGAFLISATVWQASRVRTFSGLVWAAALLFAIAIASFLAFRLKTRASRPMVENTVVGALTLAIYQTRRQVQLLDNLWWYVAPIFLGVLLLGPIRQWLATGSMHQKSAIWAVVYAAMCWGVWKLNRWTARSRLRPRLEQLEKLKSDLS